MTRMGTTMRMIQKQEAMARHKAATKHMIRIISRTKTRGTTTLSKIMTSQLKTMAITISKINRKKKAAITMQNIRITIKISYMESKNNNSKNMKEVLLTGANLKKNTMMTFITRLIIIMLLRLKIISKQKQKRTTMISHIIKRCYNHPHQNKILLKSSSRISNLEYLTCLINSIPSATTRNHHKSLPQSTTSNFRRIPTIKTIR
mmetsp:Transcript_17895/g.12855  ORF Transcript_17895/g.12855 Transcript_17895/m.12855 type:complete len:204 (+) Transcript_17895:698-1309(+)